MAALKKPTPDKPQPVTVCPLIELSMPADWMSIESLSRLQAIEPSGHMYLLSCVFGLDEGASNISICWSWIARDADHLLGSSCDIIGMAVARTQTAGRANERWMIRRPSDIRPAKQAPLVAASSEMKREV